MNWIRHSKNWMGLVAALFFLGQIDSRRSAERLVADLASRPDVKAALVAARAIEAQTMETQIRFAEIPAPPFKESARAEVVRQTFQQLGLKNVRIDHAGNVLGERPGLSPRPHVVVAAHLDTVFPDGTPVKVRREGRVLYGPGIGDDSRGLAELVAIARSLDQAHVRTPGTITFVADVGEEGLGDLRGMKELFDVTLKGTVDRFVTIDGTGLGVVHTFVGSRRYRVTYIGPGGHSFAAFGRPNPAGAIGRAIARISALQVPAVPKTTFNIGRLGGGTSVNAIPAEAWMEIEIRSVSRAELLALDARIQAALAAALADENARSRSAMLTVKKEILGERPAVALDESAPIVQLALASTRAVGAAASTDVSSNDGNYPASLGIPSIQIGAGGRGYDAHALTEHFDTTDSWLGTARAVLLTIALAQN